MVNSLLSFPSPPFPEGLDSSPVIRNAWRHHRKTSTSRIPLENGQIQTKMTPTPSKDKKPCSTCDRTSRCLFTAVDLHRLVKKFLQTTPAAPHFPLPHTPQWLCFRRTLQKGSLTVGLVTAESIIQALTEQSPIPWDIGASRRLVLC